MFVQVTQRHSVPTLCSQQIPIMQVISAALSQVKLLHISTVVARWCTSNGGILPVNPVGPTVQVRMQLHANPTPEL